MTRIDEEFIKSVKTALDDTTNNLDATTRSGLTAARYKALDQKDNKRALIPWSIPTGAFASLAAALLVFSLWSGNSVQDNSSMIEDMELLSSNESFDLLEELEFYEWLESQIG